MLGWHEGGIFLWYGWVEMDAGLFDGRRVLEEGRGVQSLLLGKVMGLPPHLGWNTAIGRQLERGIASAFDFP